MATASANSNSKIEDQRKAAEKAKSTPHPTNARARTDLIISVLRTAVNNAATKPCPAFKALDELRSDAAKSLPGRLANRQRSRSGVFRSSLQNGPAQLVCFIPRYATADPHMRRWKWRVERQRRARKCNRFAVPLACR